LPSPSWQWDFHSVSGGHTAVNLNSRLVLLVAACIYFYVVVMSLYVRYADPKDSLFSNGRNVKKKSRGAEEGNERKVDTATKMAARR